MLGYILCLWNRDKLQLNTRNHFRPAVQHGHSLGSTPRYIWWSRIDIWQDNYGTLWRWSPEEHQRPSGLLSAAFAHLPSLTASLLSGYTEVHLLLSSSFSSRFVFVCLSIPHPHDLKVGHISSLFPLCLHSDSFLVSCHTIKPSTALDLCCLCLLQTSRFQSNLFIISSKNLRGICKGKRLCLREEKACRPQVSSLRASFPLAGRSRRHPGTRQEGGLLREC